MKISVIIPIYNVALYVEECLRSVLEQDYEDLEIIIVDDCGTDNSMELVENMVLNSSRDISILRHHSNKGLSAARNTGIRQATGDYLFFLDSDDYIEPYCLSCLAQIAGIYPEADMVYGSSKAIPERPIPEDIVSRTDLNVFYDDRRKIKKMILSYSLLPIGIWNRLIKRKWLLEYQLFFKEGIVYEDNHWDFFAAKCVRRIALCKKNIHYYRFNPNGISYTQFHKRLESKDIILKDWVKNLDCCCLSSQLYAILHLAHTCYVMRFGGESRPPYIRAFYPFIYLTRFFLLYYK